MIINKGTLLIVQHCRQGTFKARALKTFDSGKEEFYPLMLEDTAVYGINTDWFKGDEIPCRASLAKITIVKE